MAADPRRVKELFVVALDLADPQVRGAFLERECTGDAELRQRVDVLLRAHDQPVSALDQPLAADPVATSSHHALPPPELAEKPGLVIAGRYKLLEQIGEGGMGTVWVAEQTQPVRRKVALKLIKAGMDSRSVLSRFEAERQALALMDHPNIARVLDGGTTEAGRPFFVMEYVKGVPFTKYCDDARLSIAERLALFVPVCQAVQHAHQKGIIHRDLKPSNILICLYDGQPVPKVIDFGLAKAMHQPLTEHTLYTAHGLMMGTPLYMSPEQAELNNLDVDTRTDVYALGVILYELLTGTTPLEKQRFKAVAFQEILRLIKEEEPPRPSARLSGSGSLPSVAAQRRLEPVRLTKLLRGELDWVVMKCLEKDRSRRYETANGLARDVQRYLADEMVEARPPSASYRLRKFARRHRAALTTAVAFAGLLVLAAAVCAWQAILTARAEEQARTERDAAEAARGRADKNFQLAKDSVDKYLSKVTDNPKLKQADFNQLRKELLETALPFFQQFAEQESPDAVVRAARGRAYHRLAVLRQALGDRDPAVADYRKALQILEPLVDEFPTVAEYRLALAESQRELGIFLTLLGQRAEAEANLRKALTHNRRLAADFPNVTEYRVQLGHTYNKLGIHLEMGGQLADAEREARQALDVREKLANEFQAVAGYQRDVAGSLNNVANIIRHAGKQKEAVALYERAIHYQRLALEKEPQNVTSRQYMHHHQSSLAAVLGMMGRLDEAAEHFCQALDMGEKLTKDFPSEPRYRSWILETHTILGNLHYSLGAWDEAARQHLEALRLAKQLKTEFPNVAGYQSDVAGSLHNGAMVLERTGKRAEALDLFEQALREERQALKLDPHSDQARVYLQEHHGALGKLLARLGRRSEAEAQFRQGLAAGEKSSTDADSDRERRNQLTRSHAHLGRLLSELGRWDEADSECRHALAVGDKLIAAAPTMQAYAIARAGCDAAAADLLRDRGLPQDALAAYDKAVAALKVLLAMEPRLVEARDALRDAHAGRARALDRLGHHADAVQYWKQAMELDDGSQRVVLQLGRAISQAQGSGNHDQALAEAESRAKGADVWTLEGLARLCALASEGNGERYAVQAVKLLRQAVREGYRDTLYLKEGADLAPLRQRDDFKKLLADLEKTKAPQW
jgi:tetratricopeptide (TPR) repeat protein